MSISFLFVFSNVSVCSAHLIISFHPSSDLLTTTISRDRLFSPLVANQTVVHLRRRSILCNSPLVAVGVGPPRSMQVALHTSLESLPISCRLSREYNHVIGIPVVTISNCFGLIHINTLFCCKAQQP